MNSNEAENSHPRSKPTGSKPKVPENSNQDRTAFCLYDEELKKHLQDLTVLSNICNNKDCDNDVGCEPLVIQTRNLQISATLTCVSCSCSFADRNEQRAHYKTDWHRYNLKQKIKGQPPVNEQMFFEMTDESSNSKQTGSDRLSSCKRSRPSPIPPYVYVGKSWSDSDSSSTDTDSESESSGVDDDENKSLGHSKILFRNGEKKILSVYRCVLFPKQLPPAHDGELIRLLCNVQDKLQWTIILIGGGRFAAAVFSGKTTLLHKTYCRYTTRAKQGTTQSTKDKQNGPQHHSAGAGLRRHNELALVQDIQNLLESWATEINKSDCIFFRAPGQNKTILFGGKTPALKKNDLRLRPIPFPTGKATFQEVQRVHEVLNSIHFYDSLEVATSTSLGLSPRKGDKKKVSNKGNKSKQPQSYHENLRKSLTKQGEPCFENFSCSSDDGESYSLIEDDEMLSTSHLKMFEVTRKPRNRHRKFENKSNV